MTLLRHLLRYGGLYLAAGGFYYVFCEAAYNGSHHYGWNGVIALHATVALCGWIYYGLSKL